MNGVTSLLGAGPIHEKKQHKLASHRISIPSSMCSLPDAYLLAHA